MSKAEEIEAAKESLSEEEYVRFKRWFSEIEFSNESIAETKAGINSVCP
ncbi:MAG: hypothetical protein NUV74_10625 [Candidatus Brocadiaceae bacterium]|nr:hypothetical protein [Candidatus Brocadiaceae bacterium]